MENTPRTDSISTTGSPNKLSAEIPDSSLLQRPVTNSSLAQPLVSSGHEKLRTFLQAVIAIGIIGGLIYRCTTTLETPETPRVELLPAAKPLRLQITTSRGPTPVYRRGEKLDFSVTVNQAAEVHCFIQNDQKEVRRLFPNLSQPHARLVPSTPIAIPGPNPSFEIDFDRAGVVEQVGCVASMAALGSPWPVELNVLQATPLPVQRLEELEDGYRQRTMGPVVLQTMMVQVR